MQFLTPVEHHETFSRNFPKDEEFYHARNLDDLLLGCMAYRGKYDQQNNQVYVKFSDWKKICNMLNSVTAITPRTITEHRKALEKLGYITEDAAAHRWIVANYYEGRKYALVRGDVLWHLITTGNRFVLKIYLYLRDGYEWQTRQNDFFTFTLKQLRHQALGYGEGRDPRNDLLIKAVLYSLATQGLINFEKEYFYINDHCDNDFILSHVSTTMQEAAEWTMSGREVEALIHYTKPAPAPTPAPVPYSNLDWDE